VRTLEEKRTEFAVPLVAVSDWLAREVTVELTVRGGSRMRRMFWGRVCGCFCRSFSKLSSEYWDSCCSSDRLSIV